MKKTSRFVFILLKNSFIVSVVGLILASLARSGSWLEIICGGIGVYVAIFTFNLFLVHLLLIFLTYIFQRDRSR